MKHEKITPQIAALYLGQKFDIVKTPTHWDEESLRDGDWIIWKCPLCPTYERRFNEVTGEMRVNRGGSDAQHAGSSEGKGDVGALVEGICEN